VQPINMEHINEIPPKEKQIKLKYFRMWVKNALIRTESLDTDQQVKEILFILQILLFKIYYLLAPEGTLLSDIRYLQKSLSNKNVHTIKELNFSIIETLKEIEEKDDDELMKSLYRVEATFAVNRPTNFNYVKKFISNELAKVTIILNEGKEDEALKVCEYILSYSSFTFGMPVVAYDLLQIVWRIFYPSYFNELGFIDEYYSKQTSFFNNELIKAKIDDILNNAKKLHKKIKFRHGNLDFSDKLKFIISFFNEFQSLNYD